MATLGETIRSLRETRGLSVTELAKRAGLANSSRLSVIEDGSAEVQPVTVHRLAGLLDVTVEALLPAGTTPGERIRYWRYLRGYTGADFARLAQVAPSALIRIEKDVVRPQSATLDRIAAALDVERATLIAPDLSRLAEHVDRDGRPRGYLGACALSRELYLPLKALRVLSADNDPFFVGAPSHRTQAEWFMALWERFHFPRGVHLRRIHYFILSHEVRLPDGQPYENRTSHFDALLDASRYARILRLVAADAFQDHRNPTPVVWGGARETPSPSWWVDSAPLWMLPSIHTAVGWGMDLPIPSLSVAGYSYLQEDQPYHLELWIEKSTMNDVLTPICRTIGATLVTSIGVQSISNVVAMLQRIARIGKPARIFYISDFDPAGDGMPVNVARQVEFWRAEYAPGADIKLQPLALTAAQIAAYQLPRTPIKDSDKRRAQFEDQYGEGAVELDALEALYPGTLRQIALDAMKPYLDLTLEDRLRAAGRQAETYASRTAHDTFDEPTSDARAAIRAEAQKIARSYDARLVALAQEMRQEMAPIQERMDALREEMDSAAADLELTLPLRPEPEVAPPDESDWLFDASRNYFDQLAVYQARKQGNSDDDDDADQDDDVA